MHLSTVSSPSPAASSGVRLESSMDLSTDPSPFPAASSDVRLESTMPTIGANLGAVSDPDEVEKERHYSSS